MKLVHIIFQTLKMYSKIYPTETIENILNKPEVKEGYLIKLQAKQNSKLNKIHPLITQLTPRYAQRATQALNKAYKIFNTESTDIIHKRTRVIELFEKTFAPLTEEESLDKEIANLILRKLESLPGSKNDISAFMVKHANKSSNYSTRFHKCCFYWKSNCCCVDCKCCYSVFRS